MIAGMRWTRDMTNARCSERMDRLVRNPSTVPAKDGIGREMEGRHQRGGELIALMFVVFLCRGSIPFQEFESVLNISARSC